MGDKCGGEYPSHGGRRQPVGRTGTPGPLLITSRAISRLRVSCVASRRSRRELLVSPCPRVLPRTVHESHALRPRSRASLLRTARANSTCSLSVSVSPFLSSFFLFK